MSENLPAVQDQQPFQRMLAHTSGINAGAVAIEQERAIAEAQGQLTLAKKFPRSVTAAIGEFLEACNNHDFATTAFYSVPNRGSGPSIRLAEEAARCYGNFVYGHRELSRSEGKSEIEVYAWDMEKNNRSSRQITVMHVLDTKNGAKKLTDQADIDNKIANVASKQMRGRILALMPKHMIAAGVAAAKRTLAGNGEKPISERILAMSQRFARFGVNATHLQAYLGHGIDDTTLDELADLTGIFNAIKEGAKASDYFKLGDDAAADANASTAAAIASRAKAAPPAAQTPAPAPAAAKPRAASRSTAAQNEGNTVKSQAAESGETQPPAEAPAPAPAPSPAPTPAPVPAPAPQAAQPDDDVF